MADVRIAARAVEDMDAIWSFIAQVSEPAADRVIGEITRAIDQLALYPESGRADLHMRNRSVRRLRVRGGWSVIYRVRATWVEVVRVVHGRRDLGALDL